MKRNESGELRVGRVQSVPERVVARAQMKGREASAEKKKKQVGWSTKMLEEFASNPEFEYTEEMVQWRSKKDRNDLWKELCGKMEEVTKPRRAHTKDVVSR